MSRRRARLAGPSRSTALVRAIRVSEGGPPGGRGGGFKQAMWYAAPVWGAAVLDGALKPLV
jgi:hypothetical protein